MLYVAVGNADGNTMWGSLHTAIVGCRVERRGIRHDARHLFSQFNERLLTYVPIMGPV